MSIESLKTSLLDHEQAIQVFEDRLDRLRSKGDEDDPQVLLIMTQIEFVLLNTRTAKYGIEQQLEWQTGVNGFTIPIPTMPKNIPLYNKRCKTCGTQFQFGATKPEELKSDCEDAPQELRDMIAAFDSAHCEHDVEIVRTEGKVSG